MRTVALLALTLLACNAEAAELEAPHHCATDALERARKLLLFHTETDEQIDVAKQATVLAPRADPANETQRFDVLAVTGYVYKAEYRMRFLCAQISDECVLVGQEILELTEL